MSGDTQARLRGAVVAVAPVVLLLGFLYQPYVGDYTDTNAFASTVADNPDRWGLSQIVIGAGLALVLVAAVAVRDLLSAHAENRWSFYALPLLLFGGAGLMAAAAGGSLVLAAVANSGADVPAVMNAGEAWLNAVYGVSLVLFALGWLGYAVAIWRAQVVERRQTQLVVLAIVVFVVAGVLPWGWAVFVMTGALIVALWPLAYRMWGEQATGRMAAPASPSPSRT